MVGLRGGGQEGGDAEASAGRHHITASSSAWPVRRGAPDGGTAGGSASWGQAVLKRMSHMAKSRQCGSRVVVPTRPSQLQPRQTTHMIFTATRWSLQRPRYVLQDGSQGGAEQAPAQRMGSTAMLAQSRCAAQSQNWRMWRRSRRYMRHQRKQQQQQQQSVRNIQRLPHRSPHPWRTCHTPRPLSAGPGARPARPPASRRPPHPRRWSGKHCGRAAASPW